MDVRLLKRTYQALNGTPIAPAAFERAVRATKDDSAQAFIQEFAAPGERRAAIARFTALAELVRAGVLDVFALGARLDALPPPAFVAAATTSLRPSDDGTPSFDPCAYLRAYATALA
jgi:hypothetical protein